MGRYSIKDLEKLSGIKSHTLRIWEKRYNFITTKRTDTNIRYYDDEDLKHILNLSYLVNHGFKISKVAPLSKSELAEKVKEISEEKEDFEYEMKSFIEAMIDFDEAYFEKIIAACSIKYGMEDTIIRIIYPVLHRIGIMWQTGSINPAQEHFFSNLIRRKLMLAIDGVRIAKNDKSPKILLFLPEGELHELGLLFANYITRKRNFQTLYLGQSVPFADIQSVYEFYQPNYLFTMVTNSLVNGDLLEYLNRLAISFPKASILVSAKGVNQESYKNLPKNIEFLNSPQKAIAFFDSAL